jgi:leucyl aminopeptidase
VQDVTYGALTACSEGTRLKSDPGPAAGLNTLVVVAPAGEDAAGMAAGIARGASLARGNLYARWLVDAPPNVCTPTYLANSAQAIADQFPDVMSCKILQKADCEAMNMGCYLAVASVRSSAASAACCLLSAAVERW